MIYLTLRGDKSQTHGDKDYIRISYADHILTWLDKCLKKTHEIVPIYQVILQYREVVRHLTGKIEPAFVKTISEFIAENPDIIRYRQEINHGIDKACGDCMDKLADGIAKELGGRFNVRRPANLAQGKFDSKPYFARIIDPPQNSPLYNKPFEIWVAEHCRGLMIGVESCFGKSPLIQEQENLLKKMYAILLQESKTSGYSCCDANNLFCGTHWLTGWHPIHPELIRIDEKWLTSLYDSKTMADTVSKVCTAIRDHIGLLEKAYNQAIQTTNTQP